MLLVHAKFPNHVAGKDEFPRGDNLCMRIAELMD